MEDMVELNPHLTVEELMDCVTFEEDGYTLKSWDLAEKGLMALPEMYWPSQKDVQIFLRIYMMAQSWILFLEQKVKL